MAIEENNRAWLVEQMREEGAPIWFCQYSQSWHDICHNAQRQADVTGKQQFLVAYPPGEFITHVVQPDPAHSKAVRG